jgi:acetyl esterase/lipase
MPCYLVVAGDIDFLSDSSARYADELENRGIVVQQKVYPDAPHDFFNM